MGTSGDIMPGIGGQVKRWLIAAAGLLIFAHLEAKQPVFSGSEVFPNEAIWDMAVAGVRQAGEYAAGKRSAASVEVTTMNTAAARSAGYTVASVVSSKAHALIRVTSARCSSEGTRVM